MPHDILKDTRCLYCQKDYSSPGRLQAHVKRMHPNTYAYYAIQQALGND